MKNYGDVKFPKGIKGYESENGYNNWWYPGIKTPVEIPLDATARHLHLWRNQDPYFVFAVPLCIFRPPALLRRKVENSMQLYGFTKRSQMKLLILKILKELVQQKKHIAREDLRNARKSNQMLLKLVYLLEIELEKNEKKSK